MVDLLLSNRLILSFMFLIIFALITFGLYKLNSKILRKLAESKSGLKIIGADVFAFAVLFTVVLGVLIGLIVMKVFLSNTVHIPEKTVLVSKDKKSILAVYKNGRYLLKSDDKIKNGYHVISFKEQRASVSMQVSPITVNPKVRKIFYDVIVIVEENEHDAFKFFRSRFKGNIFKFGVFVQRQLYEFNEKYSKDLAKFYNPLDPNQQRKFTSLVAEFLRPHLDGTGVKIERVRFDLI